MTSPSSFIFHFEREHSTAKKQQEHEVDAEMLASLIKKLFEEKQIMMKVATDGN